MDRRECYRTLDKPILILGVEPDELIAVSVIGMAAWGLAGSVAGLAAWVGAYALLRRLKRGKAPGFLFYLAYRHGLIRAAPPVPHLIRPPRRGRGSVRLSAVSSPRDAEHPLVRYYHGGRHGSRA
jgi:hypothetical protein